jgi:hypothetical protein
VLLPPKPAGTPGIAAPEPTTPLWDDDCVTHLNDTGSWRAKEAHGPSRRGDSTVKRPKAEP